MDGAGAWETAGQFPKAITGLRGVSLNNNIFMTGNILYKSSVHLVINILIIQEDTVTPFYVTTLLMDHGKKLESCSK